MIAASFILAAVLQLPISDERTARSFLNRSPHVATEEDVTTIKAELWIDDKGKTRDCQLLQFNGSREIATRMCRRVIGTLFNPARDENGEAVHGLLVETLSVYPQGYRYLSDIQQKALKNELQTVKVSLNLSETASFATVPPFINILVLVGEQGQQKSCEAKEASETDLAAVACEHTAQFTNEIRTSRKGNPVPYVRMVTVEFLQEATN